MKKKVISLRLQPNMIRSLDAEACSMGLRRSDVIRMKLRKKV